MLYNTRQKGFTLPEMLVAAAIASGIIVSTSASISSVVKSTTTSTAAVESLMEAQNLAAQIRAGISVPSLQTEFSHWKITQSPYKLTQAHANQDIILMEIIAEHKETKSLAFSTIRLDRLE